MLVMWFAVSLVAGIPLKNLGALCAGILAFFTIVIAVPQIRTHIVHDYQWVRILELIEGKKDKIDKKGDNYQANQAEIAFADGGLSGSGFLRGEQKGYVPEQQNDFIFTVIGEEGGLIGCTLVLLSYAFFFYRIWLTMVQSVDPNTKMIAGGIFAILGFHTFVNIAMVLQMLPVVGLWLPFLSYGGTAMWLCMACVGLMVGVQRREKPILF
jgi:cell division protein FtsW (lipid II flippase)